MKKITLFCFLIFAVNSYSQTQLLSEFDEVDIGGGSWINSSGFNYTYENNNLKTETYLTWTGSGWLKSDRTIYNYNVNNKVDEEIYQEYNMSSEIFEDVERIVYIYTNGNLTKIEGYIWDSGGWVIEAQTILTYSGMILQEGYTEEYDGTVWTKTIRSIISYNGNGTTMQITEYEWINDDWALDGRDVFTYDNGKISSVQSDNRNDAGTGWEEAYTTTYMLDVSGNRMSETETYVGGFTETITYTYGPELMSSFDNPFADYNGVEYLFQDYPYYNKVETKTSSSNYRTTFDYNNVLSIDDISKKEKIQINIYPNPSKDIVRLDTSEVIENIEIYNALGSKIMSTKEKQINVSHLSKGLYLINIFMENGSLVTKKLIKE